MKLNLSEAKAIVEADTVPAENREITAKWTGTYPCLCHGEWEITIGGKEVELPKDVRYSHMSTYGTYAEWSFGGDSGWEEQWDYYEDGLTYEPWVETNSWWLRDLHLTDTETQALYNAIAEEDWRFGSCGGCI